MQAPSIPLRETLAEGVERVRQAKRAQHRLDEWFYVQEIRMEETEALRADGHLDPASPEGQAEILIRIACRCPISIPHGAAIAGSQDAAFSPSYALINPSFKVEEFAGYCDPTAIYDDITPDPENGLTAERIARVRQWYERDSYVEKLQAIYRDTGDETKEVVYFVEPVTGHTIPDMRPYLEHGVDVMRQRADSSDKPYGGIMSGVLEAVLMLADRYREIARVRSIVTMDDAEKTRLEQMAAALEHVPARGARDLREAIQTFTLLWQVMTLEQAPNPYAFSAGNLDRVFLPYYLAGRHSREEAIELFRHLLTFFQVGDRCWAISQNVIVGGRDADGSDLTNEMTHIVLDAFWASNDPQPALSVKLHAGTDESLYRSLGRFFFTPGHSTPSIFNDDVMFENLRRQGVAEADLPDYSIAGCQEPLVMGKSSLNTTNSWLNLAKILELALNDGRSLISGKQIGPSWKELGSDDGAALAYSNLEAMFFKTLDHFLPRMRDAANACVDLLGRSKPIPFTSAVMDGFHVWRDMRDPDEPGARYTASGCLIHGLSVVADSLHAVSRALEGERFEAKDIRTALQNDFEGREDLRCFLAGQDKFGNNLEEIDALAARLASEVCERVGALRNSHGQPFLADWSTPSTHLLYGYWVGATPDGRGARAMLGYGLDPRPEAVRCDLPERILSAWKLPYLKMTGGCASHIGLRPDRAIVVRASSLPVVVQASSLPVVVRASSLPGSSQRQNNTHESAVFEAKGLWMRDNIIRPFFRLGENNAEAPYYVYFNIDSASNLRRVLDDPKKFAPSGVYIMRIHGTFVNFLDLSPAIQEDIICRLEAG